MGDKDQLLFRFETQQRADFWYRETLRKLESEVVSYDNQRCKIEFEDSAFYFRSKNRIQPGMRFDAEYDEIAICIILDDKERYLLKEDIDA